VKLTVFGTGGVGGYFGGRLALAGADVHLIARGAHLEALRARGLKVTSTKGDFHVELPASDDPTDIGPCDYVLFPVKSFDTDAAAGRLGPLIGERTAVLSVQNGIDDEDKIARAVGPGHVMGVSHTCSPGSSNPASSPIREGRRASCSGDGWLAQRTRTGLLGRMQEGGHRRRARQRHSAGAVGQVCVHLCPGGNDRGGQPPHWGCANGRGVLGRVQANCRGGAPAGRSRGGRAARATSRNRHARFTEGLEPTVCSSLYDDLSDGRRMELEALHGTIVQSLRQHDIPVPVSETIYAILKPWAVRNEAPTTL
jgi:2-dehydropantoate 2-reductase